ncbi:DUF2905 domain-containing protein [candidate division KSB1 bacterium]
MISTDGLGRFLISQERLPGNLHIVRQGFSLHFPAVTCVLLSVIPTVVQNLILSR